MQDMIIQSYLLGVIMDVQTDSDTPRMKKRLAFKNEFLYCMCMVLTATKITISTQVNKKCMYGKLS